MTLISAYIELFIRGKSPGGKCSEGNVWIPLKSIAIIRRLDWRRLRWYVGCRAGMDHSNTSSQISPEV